MVVVVVLLPGAQAHLACLSSLCLGAPWFNWSLGKSSDSYLHVVP